MGGDEGNGEGWKMMKEAYGMMIVTAL